MIQGSILSANIGCFHPKGKHYTYSLFDPNLAKLIGKKIHAEKYDICLLQEAWTFVEELFPKELDEYEVLGLNDMIGVRKSFGKFEPNSFRSYSKRFIQPNTGEIKAREKDDYSGSTNPNDFGIPADFDVTSAIIRTNETSEKILVVNVHVTSAPWNDERRAYEINEWIIKDAITRAKERCDGKIIIAGDFNEDETRNPKAKSSQAILALLQQPNIQDASNGRRVSTTNYPVIKRKLDHMLGTATFSNFTVGQPLLADDLKEFKKKHKFAWMYVDHRALSANFQFQ
jgi:hypothetical protein